MTYCDDTLLPSCGRYKMRSLNHSTYHEYDPVRGGRTLSQLVLDCVKSFKKARPTKTQIKAALQEKLRLMVSDYVLTKCLKTLERDALLQKLKNRYTRTKKRLKKIGNGCTQTKKRTTRKLSKIRSRATKHRASKIRKVLVTQADKLTKERKRALEKVVMKAFRSLRREKGAKLGYAFMSIKARIHRKTQKVIKNVAITQALESLRSKGEIFLKDGRNYITTPGKRTQKKAEHARSRQKAAVGKVGKKSATVKKFVKSLAQTAKACKRVKRRAPKVEKGGKCNGVKIVGNSKPPRIPPKLKNIPSDRCTVPSVDTNVATIYESIMPQASSSVASSNAFSMRSMVSRAGTYTSVADAGAAAQSPLIHVIMEEPSRELGKERTSSDDIADMLIHCSMVEADHEIRDELATMNEHQRKRTICGFRNHTSPSSQPLDEPTSNNVSKNSVYEKVDPLYEEIGMNCASMSNSAEAIYEEVQAIITDDGVDASKNAWEKRPKTSDQSIPTSQCLESFVINDPTESAFESSAEQLRNWRKTATEANGNSSVAPKTTFYEQIPSYQEISEDPATEQVYAVGRTTASDQKASRRSQGEKRPRKSRKSTRKSEQDQPQEQIYEQITSTAVVEYDTPASENVRPPKGQRKSRKSRKSCPARPVDDMRSTVHMGSTVYPKQESADMIYQDIVAATPTEINDTDAHIEVDAVKPRYTDFDCKPTRSILKAGSHEYTNVECDSSRNSRHGKSRNSRQVSPTRCEELTNNVADKEASNGSDLCDTATCVTDNVDTQAPHKKSTVYEAIAPYTANSLCEVEPDIDAAAIIYEEVNWSHEVRQSALPIESSKSNPAMETETPSIENVANYNYHHPESVSILTFKEPAQLESFTDNGNNTKLESSTKSEEIRLLSILKDGRSSKFESKGEIAPDTPPTDIPAENIRNTVGPPRKSRKSKAKRPRTTKTEELVGDLMGSAEPIVYEAVVVDAPRKSRKSRTTKCRRRTTTHRQDSGSDEHPSGEFSNHGALVRASTRQSEFTRKTTIYEPIPPYIASDDVIPPENPADAIYEEIMRPTDPLFDEILESRPSRAPRTTTTNPAQEPIHDMPSDDQLPPTVNQTDFLDDSEIYSTIEPAAESKLSAHRASMTDAPEATTITSPELNDPIYDEIPANRVSRAPRETEARRPTTSYQPAEQIFGQFDENRVTRASATTSALSQQQPSEQIYEDGGNRASRASSFSKVPRSTHTPSPYPTEPIYDEIPATRTSRAPRNTNTTSTYPTGPIYDQAPTQKIVIDADPEQQMSVAESSAASSSGWEESDENSPKSKKKFGFRLWGKNKSKTSGSQNTLKSTVSQKSASAACAPSVATPVAVDSVVSEKEKAPEPEPVQEEYESGEEYSGSEYESSYYSESEEESEEKPVKKGWFGWGKKK